MRFFMHRGNRKDAQRNDCWWYLVLRDRTESWKGGGGAGMNVEVKGVVAEISDREEMRRRLRRVALADKHAGMIMMLMIMMMATLCW
ncbi:uncharacterized protein K452DRAFT_289030 [Aplosporella prunicola CBS 121167]|uniref:Uncharacterized protein n=1 Tax=Aplosporella prunicola CBS 121167 TaxID=1176127 RepID=A0A6A6BAI9_9PEZI|nr:uncharacterized protein K452DRAFT_289030 [Aplosporella prunicola CBS 121167]KAF2140264.1 hypothetical protein K452DRAFT_289030 [Aplosporella prunicola CBS 121167]